MTLGRARCFLVLMLTPFCARAGRAAEDGPIAHWPMQRHVEDAGPRAIHGTGNSLKFPKAGPNAALPYAAEFDGARNVIRIDASPHLDFGRGDFTLAAWVYTDPNPDDLAGDLISKYDPATRRGFSLGFVTNAAAASSLANDRQLSFFVSDGSPETAWIDHGRLGDAIFVFGLVSHAGQLYASTCEAGPEQTGRVFRWKGRAEWEDLGSPDRSNSVTALASWNGALYAATGKYRLKGSSLAESENPNPGGRVFRFEAPGKWIDCGRLGESEAAASLVVYRGELYASSLYSPGFYKYEGGTNWASLGTPDAKRVEAMTVHNGAIWAGCYDAAFIFRYTPEGGWKIAGEIPECTQTYGFAVAGGGLHVGTWPTGSVHVYESDGNWPNLGRLGEEKEVMGMAFYHGALYAGTLPLAEVYRRDGSAWRSLGRIDMTPDVVYRRVWSMAVHGGRLFCGTLPSGRVWSLSAGQGITSKNSIEPGWRQVAAKRTGGQLQLFIDGVLEAEAGDPAGEAIDVNCGAPMLLGSGAQDFFKGRMADVRVYAYALPEDAIPGLFAWED